MWLGRIDSLEEVQYFKKLLLRIRCSVSCVSHIRDLVDFAPSLTVVHVFQFN